jgi:uncharacterized protein (TIGR00369 family)
MEVVYADNKAMCQLSLKPEYQGWKDIVHGGVIATILDEIMAHAVMHYVGNAVTTSLKVTYRTPLRVGQEIKAEGYVIQKRSRGAVARGEIRGLGNSEVIATAESRLIFHP